MADCFVALVRPSDHLDSVPRSTAYAISRGKFELELSARDSRNEVNKDPA